MNDPIGDLFTRIRNAQAARKTEVSMPLSTLKMDIVNVLQEEGYIESFNANVDANNKPQLTIKLKYFEGKPVIEKIKQISKPGLRIYRPYRKLNKVKGGMGIAIISTPQGVKSDRSARAIKQGGEVLVEVM
jgi:small subunit ribosomal protein S8